MGPQWEFARRFAKGIEKLTGNTLGDRRKKTKRLIAGMPEAVGLMVLNRLYPYFTGMFKFFALISKAI
ncbi:hypothetical protein BHM03_00051063 [Ensete ventricosum]|nr:hypothetical protein BHM03_00051063 [Ensete ventricosum]